jgi:hypothetical protein
MFVQVIQGQVYEPAQMRPALDGWHQELAPAAAGWLGPTAGVTDDGRFGTGPAPGCDGRLRLGGPSGRDPPASTDAGPAGHGPIASE